MHIDIRELAELFGIDLHIVSPSDQSNSDENEPSK
jgi:hypothetical protein